MLIDGRKDPWFYELSLKRIRAGINKSIKDIKLDTDFSIKHLQTSYRRPNIKEQREWMRMKLRGLGVPNKHYQTLKGLVGVGKVDEIFSYLRNHEYHNVYEIRQEFTDFCETESIPTISADIIFKTPVKSVTIEIDANKKGWNWDAIEKRNT